MSNYKKKQEAKVLESKYEEMTTKRDLEIVGTLKQTMLQQKLPLDKVKMQWFYSGAKWADEHPDKRLCIKYMLLGFLLGMVGVVIAFITR